MPLLGAATKGHNGRVLNEQQNVALQPAVDPSRGVMLQLEPGDVALFSGYTPHRSASNASTHWRRLLYLSYNRRSDGGERRATHYDEFRTWLQTQYAAYGRTETYFR